MSAFPAAALVAQEAFGRDLDLTSSLGVLIALQTTYSVLVVVLAGMMGSPRRWPGWLAALVALAGLGASIAWWWVNHDIEGTVLVTLSQNHGVTTGDLLSLPMLVTAGLVMVFALVGPGRGER